MLNSYASNTIIAAQTAMECFSDKYATVMFGGCSPEGEEKKISAMAGVVTGVLNDAMYVMKKLSAASEIAQLFESASETDKEKLMQLVRGHVQKMREM